MEEKINAIYQMILELSEDFKVVKEDVNTLKEDVSALKVGQDKLNGHFAYLREEMMTQREKVFHLERAAGIYKP